MTTNQPESPWTDERIETLSTLWREGHKASAIATTMHTTRNAVLGKLHRLGLIGHDRPKAQPLLPRPKLPKKAPPLPPRSPKPATVRIKTVAAPTAPPKAVAKAAPKPPAPEKAAPAPAPTPRKARVSILAARPFQCRWIDADPRDIPPGEPLYCGRPTVSETCSYCDEHAALAYTPRHPMRRAA